MYVSIGNPEQHEKTSHNQSRALHGQHIHELCADKWKKRGISKAQAGSDIQKERPVGQDFNDFTSRIAGGDLGVAKGARVFIVGAEGGQSWIAEKYK